MTAVTIRGTFEKDSRPSNGLETIADELVADKSKVYYVVGAVKWAGGSVSEEGDLLPATKFLAIEPLAGDSADAAKKILDDARKARGLGRAEDEFVRPSDPALFEFDEDGAVGISREAVIRIGPDGPREVPPPSGEEVLAERAEAKANGKPKPTTEPFNPGGAE